MTDKEHLAQIRWMTDEEREAIERRMLIEMAERFGGVQENFRKKHMKNKRKREKSA